MRRLSLIGAWLIMLTLLTTLTWQIVSAADDRVSDRPVSPLNVAAPVLTSDTTATTVPEPTPTTTTPSATTTTTTESTSTTQPATTTTTQATTTTTTAASWSVKSIPTAGGTVVLLFRPGEVKLQTATPTPGFKAEVEDAGPPQVRVEFESESTKVEVRAQWEDSGLDVEVSTSDED